MAITSSQIIRTIERVSGSVDVVSREAANHDLRSWRTRQWRKVGLLGAAAAGVPIFGYATLPAELVVLARRMYRAGIGVGCIKNGEAHEDDFINILAVWSGHTKLSDDLGRYLSTQILAHDATIAGGQSTAKLMAKAFALTLQSAGGRMLGPKVAQQIATKLAPHITSKTATRFIPGVSAAVGAYMNVWIINQLLKAAEKYYDFINEYSSPRDTVKREADSGLSVGTAPERLSHSVVHQPLDSDMIGVPDAAKRLRVSRATVYDWVKKKRLLGWKSTKRRLTIPAEQILGPRKVVPAIFEVLESIENPELAWAFLSEEWPFADSAARPIDKLKAGEIEEVLRAIPSFGRPSRGRARLPTRPRSG